jgi:crossover junction endodeoxyribonuclease RuvC
MARSSSRSLWTAKLRGGTVLPPQPTPGPTKKKPAATAMPTTRGSKAIILGIDPSLRGTGLAVIDTRGATPKLLTSLTVKLPAKLEPYECLGKIADAVETLAKRHGVTEAAIEETIYVQNFRTAQAMGASRGAALSVLARLGATVREYAPARIKMAVTGHGAAKKEQVGRMVKAVFGLTNELPLDESDATAVALCHAYTAR